jgi:ribosomal-protein-alanine N-acetyltransferase
LRAADAQSYRAVLVEALSVHPDCFCSDYHEELERTLEETAEALEHSGTFGAWLGGLLAGVGSGVPCSEWKRRHCGRLRNLYVRAKFRRQGIARLLLREILQYSAHGVERLEVEVPSPCENVVRLFEQFGFRMCGLVRNGLQVGQQRLDVWTMGRPLR